MSKRYTENYQDNTCLPRLGLATRARRGLRSTGRSLWSLGRCWFDNQAVPITNFSSIDAEHIDWSRTIPFLLLHVACLAVIWVGWSPIALIMCILLYAIRMLAITGFYHRYFAHRTFKTTRLVQSLFALIGASAGQRGPLWWASHHRHHHAHADGPSDAHSPQQKGFLWSHMGWFLSRANFPPKQARIPDLVRFEELRLIDRFDVIAPLLLAVTLYASGAVLERTAPALGTSGPQLLVWGFFISTVLLYHATYLINSVGHSIGHRRYATRDSSRNNFILALLTFGEGWHNNHHYYAHSARQGFYWWEVDFTYYFLRGLYALGLIWDLKTVPADVRDGRGRA